MSSVNSPYDNYGYAVVAANALRTPDRTAIAYRGRRYSFDELNRRVNRRANALTQVGIKAGQRVGSLLSDALPIAELYLAEAKLGAVIAAFNAFWDDEMVVQMAIRSGLDAMIFDAAHAAQAARVRDRLPDIGLWLSVGGPADSATDLDALVDGASEAEPPLGAFGGDPMAFFYTSGTSGTSKAVVHSHTSCRAMSEVLGDMPRDEDDVWGTGPIIWGIGFPCTLGAALYGGMTVALEDDFGPANLLKTVQRERVSHCTLIPSQIADLLANHPHQDYDLSSLKIILSGGEPMGATLLGKIKERFPDVKLYGFYGQTELPYACTGRLEDTSGGVGRPRARCAARILAPDGKAVIGQPGELIITGPQRLTAYYGQPEKTAENLRDGWFYTGDIGIIDEQGRLHMLGRKEDAIAKGGTYVRPADIEDVVSGLPGVGEAGVVGAPAVAAEQKIILAVSPARGASLTEQDIRAALAGRLAPEAQPDLIVIADELPHTNDGSGGKGKLLRRDIRTRYEPLLAGK